ncbi:MAG: hypothetical protein HQL36_10545 [Alphaproteobacteria bacterium]|nr:hypothetical protein [Alphaproteobacteria bacterium]MBF0251925.1 hypothetical protein [Alphaproteobacteria bacterium]
MDDETACETAETAPLDFDVERVARYVMRESGAKALEETRRLAEVYAAAGNAEMAGYWRQVQGIIDARQGMMG